MFCFEIEGWECVPEFLHHDILYFTYVTLWRYSASSIIPTMSIITPGNEIYTKYTIPVAIELALKPNIPTISNIIPTNRQIIPRVFLLIVIKITLFDWFY